ncbi:MAG: hypothetical protein M3Y37_02895 [Chloroflexota bacterium]|nr:hypothetical protein [Chloroflexota bacterium]
MSRSVRSICLSRRSLLTVAAAGTLALPPIRLRAAEQTFAVTELAQDFDGRAGIFGRAINRKATVVGIATTELGPMAVRSRGETAWPLPSDGQPSIANAVNGAGTIAGSVADRAATWTDDIHTMLAPFGEDRTVAYAINSDGIVVGSADKGANNGVALLWRDDEVIELPSLGGPASRAVAINDDGLVVGFSTRDEAGEVVRAVSWIDGEVTDLGTLGGDLSTAFAVNERGVIVGSSTRDEGFSAVDHAMRVVDGEMERLEEIGAVKIRGREERVKLDRSVAQGINAGGDICGAAMSVSENDPVSVALLWLDGAAIDLNNVIGKDNREIRLTSADGINDDREIVCTGILLEDEDPQPRLFRLMPT